MTDPKMLDFLERVENYNRESVLSKEARRLRHELREAQPDAPEPDKCQSCPKRFDPGPSCMGVEGCIHDQPDKPEGERFVLRYVESELENGNDKRAYWV